MKMKIKKMKTHYSLFFLALTGCFLISVVPKALAEDWGDLGYTKPAQPLPAVVEDNSQGIEPLPASITQNEAAAATSPSYASNTTKIVAHDAVLDPVVTSSQLEEANAKSNVSTVKNTFGVETEENPNIKLYVGPYAGMKSVFGNSTVDVSSQYAAGASAGVLISGNMLFTLNYTYSEQNVSNPKTNTGNVLTVDNSTNVYSLKSNSFDAGMKMFFLGRESKFRPYFGGGFGYTKSYFNFKSEYSQLVGANAAYTAQPDFMLNQFNAFGEVGSEFAISKSLVANVSFKLNGVLSGNTSTTSNPSTAPNYNTNTVTAGNSLSRTASYAIAGGLGFYF